MYHTLDYNKNKKVIFVSIQYNDNGEGKWINIGRIGGHGYKFYRYTSDRAERLVGPTSKEAGFRTLYLKNEIVSERI